MLLYVANPAMNPGWGGAGEKEGGRELICSIRQLQQLLPLFNSQFKPHGECKQLCSLANLQLLTSC